jgi:CRP/FNR family transcriptional regulator
VSTNLREYQSGFFKTVVNSDNGQSHLLGFQMAGDALGMDGIAANIHLTEATAIEDSNVCAIPFMSVEKLSRTSPKFQRKFLQFMSLEIGRENKSLIIFSQMPAEERVATFIQNLIWRLKTRGFSSSEIIMRMTRVEIGQFLGLTIETISRTFAKFSKLGILAVDKKKIRILNKSALAEFARVPEC